MNCSTCCTVFSSPSIVTSVVTQTTDVVTWIVVFTISNTLRFTLRTIISRGTAFLIYIIFIVYIKWLKYFISRQNPWCTLPVLQFFPTHPGVHFFNIYSELFMLNEITIGFFYQHQLITIRLASYIKKNVLILQRLIKKFYNLLRSSVQNGRPFYYSEKFSDFVLVFFSTRRHIWSLMFRLFIQWFFWTFHVW